MYLELARNSINFRKCNRIVRNLKGTRNNNWTLCNCKWKFAISWVQGFRRHFHIKEASRSDGNSLERKGSHVITNECSLNSFLNICSLLSIFSKLPARILEYGSNTESRDICIVNVVSGVTMVAVVMSELLIEEKDTESFVVMSPPSNRCVMTLSWHPNRVTAAGWYVLAGLLGAFALMNCLASMLVLTLSNLLDTVVPP